MKIKKLKNLIRWHFEEHGVHLKLKVKSFNERSGRLIFRCKMRAGTKVEAIFSCASDIQTALRIPVFQLFKDGLDICLAVSRKTNRQNSLFDMLCSAAFNQSKAVLPFAIGYDEAGRMVFEDLDQIKHIMYGGATYSGKSAGLINLIISLIVKQSAKDLNLIICDTITLELGIFDGIQHLSHPVVKDIQTGRYVIKKLLEEAHMRMKCGRDELSKKSTIVCIIDEFPLFIDCEGNKKQSEELAHDISALLCYGRHAKIYIALAAQDPTIGNMKVKINNITSRMAFRCAKNQHSTTILGEGGAEKLQGDGTALYKSRKYPNPVHLQGAYMPVEEIEDLVSRIKQRGDICDNKFVIPEQEIQEIFEQSGEESYCILPVVHNDTEELAKIIMWSLEGNDISARQIKDKFVMGNRANDFIDEMHKMGIISGKYANQPRKVLPQCADDVPENVRKILLGNGYTDEDINKAFSRKNRENR